MQSDFFPFHPRILARVNHTLGINTRASGSSSCHCRRAHSEFLQLLHCFLHAFEFSLQIFDFPRCGPAVARLRHTLCFVAADLQNGKPHQLDKQNGEQDHQQRITRGLQKIYGEFDGRQQLVETSLFEFVQELGQL